MLLLKFTIPNDNPKNNALDKSNNFTLLDLIENFIEAFICPIYSFKEIGCTLSSTITVCLNLKDITVDATQHKKHKTIGIYPFIANVRPAIIDETASNK